MAKDKGDKGRQESDRELRRLEKKIKKESVQALDQMQDEANKYFAQFEASNKEKLAAVARGDLTEAQYNEWRRQEMLSGARYDDMVDNLAEDLTHRNQIAARMINKSLPNAYAINNNYAAYQVCQESGKNISFALVDHATVEKLMKDNPHFLPQKAGVKYAKDIRWNKRKIRSALTQGILTGESNNKIAARLRSVADMSEAASIRNARTMTTAAENAGRMDRYEESQKMGIKMKKTWVATIDDRTRDSHILLDGQTVDIDEPFHSIDGDIMYPGDPDADPANVYNCRCTMITQIEGYEHDISDRVAGGKLADNYEDWKEQAEERVRNREK